MMRRIVLLGAGGHAQVVFDTLKLCGDAIQVIAVLDDAPHLWGQLFQGHVIDGPLAKLAQLPVDGAFVAIGDNRARQRASAIVRAAGVPLINALHPRAVIAADAILGSGIAAFANVVVNPGARIADAVILNTACTVDHHGQIGAHAHIAPGAHLAGGVRVGEGALIGIGAAVIPQILIGKWATIGAGSVVVRDVPDHATVVGVPARILKRKD